MLGCKSVSTPQTASAVLWFGLSPYHSKTEVWAGCMGEGASEPRSLQQTLALACWMGGYHFNVLLLLLELHRLPHPIALACLALHLYSCMWPALSDKPPEWGRRLAGALRPQLAAPCAVQSGAFGACRR